MPDRDKRWELVRTVYEDLGHKGIFAVQAWLLDWFWWPSLAENVKYFIWTCHACQTQQMQQVLILPSIPELAPLFQKIHIDTKVILKVERFWYIIHAHCLLSSYPEFCILYTENRRAIRQFIFKELLCWYGVCPELVTDNRTLYVTVLDYLQEQYHINHIWISVYNLYTNRIIEHKHLDMQEAIVKTVRDNIRH